MQRNQQLDKFRLSDSWSVTAPVPRSPTRSTRRRRGTFAALITLGFDFSFRLPKPICKGDAARSLTDVDGQVHASCRCAGCQIRGCRCCLRPARRARCVAQRCRKRANERWLTPQRDPGAGTAGGIRWLTPRRSVGAAVSAGCRRPAAGRSAGARRFAERIAIILTGDGGWAGLDIAVADQLAKRGIAVVGLNTLKFFWQTRKPEEAADALTRIIGHYGAQHAHARFRRASAIRSARRCRRS